MEMTTKKKVNYPKIRKGYVEFDPEKLKKCRLDNHLTQRSMAELLSVKYKTILNYESGHTPTMPEKLKEAIETLFDQPIGVDNFTILYSQEALIKVSPYPFPEDCFLIPKGPDVEMRCTCIHVGNDPDGERGKVLFEIRLNNEYEKRIGWDGVRLAIYNDKLYFVPSGKDTPGCFTYSGNKINISDKRMVDKLRIFAGKFDLEWDEEHNVWYTIPY